MDQPRQNRVLPTGEIVAIPARGTLMGNRGILHDATGHLGVSRWKHKAWVCCRLAFKGRRRPVMAPNAYTELFFLDEAVALAAGHRPCAECRREDFLRFRSAWASAFGAPRAAPEIDAALHRARVRRDRAQVRHEAPAEHLPSGVFVLIEGIPHLLTERHALPFAPAGYGPAHDRPRAGKLTVLTPAPAVSVLAAGYSPSLHPTAAL